MAVQLQVRNKFTNNSNKPNDGWTCDGETNRNEPTKFMRETAAYYRREKDYEIRYVYDKKEFVK